MAKRLPPQTPGIAVSVGIQGGGFTLPMELHRDAVLFYVEALKAQRRAAAQPDVVASADDRRAVGRYVRASIVAAFSSLEAELNASAASHAEMHSDVLEPIVRDVLRGEETTVDELGRIFVRRRTMPLKARISFLTAFLSGQELDRSGRLWEDLRKAIDLRDRCVHPKPPFPYEWNPKDAEHVINTVGALHRETTRLIDEGPALPSDISRLIPGFEKLKGDQMWWRDAADHLEAMGLTMTGEPDPGPTTEADSPADGEHGNSG